MSNYLANINFVPKANIKTALGYFERNGDLRSQEIFYLKHPQKHTINTAERFFESLLYTFPLDPLLTMSDSHRWGSIIDSVGGGIRGIEAQLVDVVWEDVDKVATDSIPILIRGIDILDYALFGFKDVNFHRRVFSRILLTYDPTSKFFFNIWTS